jgi:DNA-binding GntR family transcriptional regulator
VLDGLVFSSIVYNVQYHITRSRARDQAKLLLQAMIADGVLSDGEHLDEIGLSRRIGVSRTPLREALIALEAEGLVHSAPNKGFRVVAANEALVRDVFPILAALEAQAVRRSGRALTDAAPRLAALNTALLKAKRKTDQYSLDAAFHRTLTEHAGPRLQRLLETHRDLAARFDGAHARGMADLEGSCAEHAAIVEAISRGKLDRAADTLLAHWRRGEDVVIAWLKGHP